MTLLSRPLEASVPHRRRPEGARPIRICSWSSDDSDFVYSPREDDFVPPLPPLGPNFWPRRVRFRLPYLHVANNNRAAQLEILRAVEWYASVRPTNEPRVDDLHSDYLGLITTSMAGDMTPRTWELWREEQGFEIRFRCRGPFLSVAARRARLLDPIFWNARDSMELGVWMETFGRRIITPFPLHQWDPARNAARPE